MISSAERYRGQVDRYVSETLEDSRRQGGEISSAHNESNLKNTAQFTQIIGKIYGFTPQELKLAYFAGSLHDIKRSPREGSSADAEDSAMHAYGALVTFNNQALFPTTEEERVAVADAIVDHGSAPAFFTYPELRDAGPQTLSEKIHMALFVADKMTANGSDVLRRRSSFVGGERLHRTSGDLQDFGFKPNRDEALVVAAESAIRLSFINPESMYPKKLEPVVHPMYETQREFVRGVYKGLGLHTREIAELLLGTRRQKDDMNLLEVRKEIDFSGGVDELAALLAEESGITDEDIDNTPQDVADAALETVTYFSSHYKEDLDSLVGEWNPNFETANRWKKGMEDMQNQIAFPPSGDVYSLAKTNNLPYDVV